MSYPHYPQGPSGARQDPPPAFPPGAAGQSAWSHSQGPAGPRQRPGRVLAGSIMTFVGAGLMVLLGLLLLVAASNEDFVAGFTTELGAGTLGSGFVTGFGVFALLVGSAVIVLAAFALRGSNGARIALTVIGGLFILADLASIVLGSPRAIVGLIWIAVAITLFWSGDASAWYRTARR